MAKLDALSPTEILKVTLMVAVGAWVLKQVISMTGIGKQISPLIP